MGQVAVSFEIPVTEGQIAGVSALVVDGKALHKALGSHRSFSNWISHKTDRLRLHVDYEFEFKTPNGRYNRFVEAQDLVGISKTAERRYILSLDAAKLIAMAEGTDQGHRVRVYFLECEKKYHAAIKAPVPAPMSVEDSMRALFSDKKSAMHLIRTLADQVIEHEEALERAQSVIEEQSAVIEDQKPAVAFVEKLVASDTTYGFQEASRLLGMPPNLLGSRLRDMGYLFRRSAGSRNKFYAQFGEAQKGFFMERLTREGFPETRVTPKGLAHFRTLFAQGQLALPAPVQQKAIAAPVLEDMEDLFGFSGLLN